jgi:hypothetical protein
MLRMNLLLQGWKAGFGIEVRIKIGIKVMIEVSVKVGNKVRVADSREGTR